MHSTHRWGRVGGRAASALWSWVEEEGREKMVCVKCNKNRCWNEEEGREKMVCIRKQ